MAGCGTCTVGRLDGWTYTINFEVRVAQNGKERDMRNVDVIW